MKNKLTVNKLALCSLRERRRQYAIMITGIILAMVFSSGIIMFIAGVAETAENEQYVNCGYQNAIIWVDRYTEEDYENDVADNIIESYSFAHIIGYACPDDGEENHGASVAWLDDETKKLSNQTFIDGAYPQNENEIAIEQTALSRLGYENAKIGDEITLKLKVQNNGEYNDAVEKTYTLSGIASDKKDNLDSNPDCTLIPALFVAQNTQTETGGLEKLVAYVTVDSENGHFADSDTGYHLGLFFYYFGQSEELGGADSNITVYSDAYFLTESLRTDNNNGYIIYISIMLCFASCTAIVNSFNTNLKERKNQIGMLRAVGATKRQIINIFGREALFISLIATPASLALSYFIVRILLGFLYDAPVMTKSIAVLPIAAAVNILIVMLAALLGLISAARITPVQAIRNIDINRKMKVKKIKSKKNFTPQKHIAKRNLKLYKSSMATVSIMLVVTIVISCFAFSYLSYLDEKIDSYTEAYKYDYSITNISGFDLFEEEWGGDLSMEGSGTISESERYEISALSYVSDVFAQKAAGIRVHLDELNDYIKILRTNDYYTVSDMSDYEAFKTAVRSQQPEESYYSEKETYSISDEFYNNCLFGFDKAELSELENYVISGEIDYDRLASGEEIILVAPETAELKANYDSNNMMMDSAVVCDGDAQSEYAAWETIAEAECPYSAGDAIDISLCYWDEDTDEFINIEKHTTVGAIIRPADANRLYMFKNTSATGGFNFVYLTTNDGIDSFYQGLPYILLGINTNVPLDEETDAEITQTLEYRADLYKGTVISKYATISKEVSEYNAMYLSVLALIIIAFAVCASIINNSITARIRENKRVIGTLRAVGADRKELTMSYVRQTFSMFSIGTATGFGAFLAAWCVLKTIGSFRTLTLYLNFSPWVAVIMTAVLFAVSALNVYSKIRKEMKNSIVDNIREL